MTAPALRDEAASPLAAELPAVGDFVETSSASISYDGGGGLTLWSTPGTITVDETAAETRLQLHPERPVVVGRQQGGEVPYLDPLYAPTRLLPESGKTVLRQDGGGSDMYVSRGHFLLKAAAGGVVLVNGVPRRGGGVRPPRNGTWLLAPVSRPLRDGEEYLIGRGTGARFHLPNGTNVLIHAE